MEELQKIIKLDEELAASRGITFCVSKKEGKGKKWIRLMEGLVDLNKALKLAKEIDCFEAAVFAVSASGGGVFYWSSRNPDLFSSDIIKII